MKSWFSRNPIAINTSFSAHLIEAHRGYEVTRKALEVEPQIGLDKRMEEYAAYKGRHSPKYHFSHGVHSFYENHKRLGQVRLRVEYRIFSPDFFWWGPKVSLLFPCGLLRSYRNVLGLMQVFQLSLQRCVFPGIRHRWTWVLRECLQAQRRVSWAPASAYA